MDQHNTEQAAWDSLVDIRDVEVDLAKPPEKHIRSYVEQFKAPYCFRMGNVKVRVSYSGRDGTKTASLCNLLSSL